MEVVEAMDDSAGDAKNVAGADFSWAAVDGHGEDDFEAVEGLLVGVVAVGDGGPSLRGNVEFEEGDGAS